MFIVISPFFFPQSASRNVFCPKQHIVSGSQVLGPQMLPIAIGLSISKGLFIF